MSMRDALYLPPSSATVPITISDNAVATRSQIESTVASKVRPSHRRQGAKSWLNLPAPYPRRNRRLERRRRERSGLFKWRRRRRILGIGVDYAEMRRDLGVEEPDVLLFNQRQQPFRFIVGDDELDLHR